MTNVAEINRLRLIASRDNANADILAFEDDFERIAKYGPDGTDIDLVICRMACYAALANALDDQFTIGISDGVDEPDEQPKRPPVVVTHSTTKSGIPVIEAYIDGPPVLFGPGGDHQIPYTPAPLSPIWRRLLVPIVLAVAVLAFALLAIGRAK